MRLAMLMKWHIEGKSKDKVTQFVVDSKAKNHVNNKWPRFAKEDRNVRLGLALDSVNPFRIQNFSVLGNHTRKRKHEGQEHRCVHGTIN